MSNDFVFSTLIANHRDPAAASRALQLAEAAVLRRAADAISALPQDYECDPGRGDAAERLLRTAEGIEEKCGPAVAGVGTASDFFQPGCTYTDRNGYRAPEITTIFRVEYVTRHPDRGHLRAIGWARTGEPGATWHGDFRDEGEFVGWTEMTEGGAS